MNRTARVSAPDYPLFPRGWMILAAALLAWSAFIGVAGSVMALIAHLGGVE